MLTCAGAGSAVGAAVGSGVGAGVGAGVSVGSGVAMGVAVGSAVEIGAGVSSGSALSDVAADSSVNSADSGSGVCDIKIKFGVSCLVAYTDISFLSEFNGIGRKIGEYLCNPVPVCLYGTGGKPRLCYYLNISSCLVDSHLEKLLQVG